MEQVNLAFYVHEQSAALQTFLPILHHHLPQSNPLYNRLQAPHNIASRRCLFAATFPPPAPGSASSVPEFFTILFSDRSRHNESQIWIFNPIIRHPGPLPQLQQDALSSHLLSAILFLKKTSIPDAPGWPFSSLLRFASLHEAMTKSMEQIAKPIDAMPRVTSWNTWITCTTPFSSSTREKRRLPDGFQVGRITEDQLGIVLATSTIKRQSSTYLILPSVGLFNVEGLLVAWGFIGIDGSLATLYVLPEYRGRGLASYVAEELLRKLNEGDFKNMGYDGTSGWVQSDVKDGNEGSERVMKALGGKILWTSNYVWIDSDKL